MTDADETHKKGGVGYTERQRTKGVKTKVSSGSSHCPSIQCRLIVRKGSHKI